VRSWLGSAAVSLATLLTAVTGAAQSSAPVQLTWQAPANCPQEAQVKQKLRELLGGSAGDVTPSRLRAEGTIEPIAERFRLTLNIHYDLVNGSRVVTANSCEDLGGVAAITLALLFRTEHSSTAPLTERDLGGAAAALDAENRSADAENRSSEADGSDTADKRSTDAERSAAVAPRSGAASTVHEEHASSHEGRAPELGGSNSASWRFAFRLPELRADLGVLPAPSYGIGLSAGVRHEAWRLLVSGTFWSAQDYDSGPFVGYGARFGRISGELSVCRGFRVGGFELAPCSLLSLDEVSARATGVGLVPTNPKTVWLSLGVGFQALWSLNRSVAVVLGVDARVATSKPRFVSESVGEIAQVGPVALGVVLGCEWVL
jgi:hypothetical protein